MKFDPALLAGTRVAEFKEVVLRDPSGEIIGFESTALDRAGAPIGGGVGVDLN